MSEMSLCLWESHSLHYISNWNITSFLILFFLHLKIKYKPTIIRLSSQYCPYHFTDSVEYLLKVDFLKIYRLINGNISRYSFSLTITGYGIICQPKLFFELLKSSWFLTSQKKKIILVFQMYWLNRQFLKLVLEDKI